MCAYVFVRESERELKQEKKYLCRWCCLLHNQFHIKTNKKHEIKYKKQKIMTRKKH